MGGIGWVESSIGLTDMSKCIIRVSYLYIDDDLLCELLLDLLYLNFNSHKFSENCTPTTQHGLPFKEWFTAERQLLARSLLDLVQHYVIVKRDLTAAADKIVNLLREPPSRLSVILKKFTLFVTKISQKQLGDFKWYDSCILKYSHMEKYLGMYLPGAGFELMRTFRYSTFSDKVEGCLVATKRWRKGDQMTNCTGTVIRLTAEEEEALGKRDYSLIYSERYKSTSMFLGMLPAPVMSG